jgi:hypothetical protein
MESNVNVEIVMKQRKVVRLWHCDKRKAPDTLLCGTRGPAVGLTLH